MRGPERAAGRRLELECVDADEDHRGIGVGRAFRPELAGIDRAFHAQEAHALLA